MDDLLRDFNKNQKKADKALPKKVDYWGEYEEFQNDDIEMIPAIESPAKKQNRSMSDQLSDIRDEEPTPKPKQDEMGEVTDTFADDFSEEPIQHSRLNGKEDGLRKGGEFNFKNMLVKQDSEDRNGADSQLFDDDDQPMVTHSEDYPTPSVDSDEENWKSKAGIILNVERLIDEVLKRETLRFIDDYKSKNGKPSEKPQTRMNTGP